MGNFLRQAKGYLMTGVAFAACPCHLPITLPVLLSLTAGTALGGWLAANTALLVAVLTVVFVGGLALGLKWIGAGPAPKKNRSPSHSGRTGKTARVTHVTSTTCGKACAKARAVWQSLEGEARIRLEEVDIASPRGRDLAARHNIFSTPTTLIDGRVAFRGVPKTGKARAALKA